MTIQTFTVRWGILATGGIASLFTKDLLVPPSSRNVTDIQHTVTAIASSSSLERAKAFADAHNLPSATLHDSYEALAADPNVDIVYVATPHSHHFRNAMLCLQAGKAVLCEKPITVNARQAQILADTAKQNGVFLMEAVWTRFFPLTKAVGQIVSSGQLGSVHRVLADMSFGEEIETKWGTEHRLVNLDLAGGVLLDLGIYSLTWVFEILYRLGGDEYPKVMSTMTKYAPTGSDETTSVLLRFPRSGAQGIALSGLRVSSDPDGMNSARPAIRIQGTKGEIQIDGPCYRPTAYRLIPKLQEGETAAGKKPIQDVEMPIPGHGMFWEADECGRCLRDGKLESEIMSLQESIAIMRVMDEVREQNDFVYPAELESTDY
ncbi:hypothetical protein ASPZODRAFT_130086 [Penicilliopsis zonata CBS 506.65]|uniref:D-xylose 1-dehydrogenase (NADP(+), D-xylono-1,5-lactone-forming) n=1 Tax=Penicilliopsis zonata CBS 506.65 TaxID=1073090 RepID=A0A1L9SM67_9EURO|nr:hypothetical protein ASPZODRAFT_130086 [Penicilliopsis zonata CBS 506.65]OJJ48144.1 hypothetical protein ASPZODRAFT_130086 [Penicilliopsis zonata CBS 506.65]